MPGFPTLSLNSGKLSAEACVAIANAISKDITDFVESQNTGCGASLKKRDYDAIMVDLEAMFEQACSAVEAHGLVVSDCVACPIS